MATTDQNLDAKVLSDIARQIDCQRTEATSATVRARLYGQRNNVCVTFECPEQLKVAVRVQVGPYELESDDENLDIMSFPLVTVQTQVAPTFTPRVSHYPFVTTMSIDQISDDVADLETRLKVPLPADEEAHEAAYEGAAHTLPFACSVLTSLIKYLRQFMSKVAMDDTAKETQETIRTHIGTRFGVLTEAQPIGAEAERHRSVRVGCESRCRRHAFSVAVSRANMMVDMTRHCLYMVELQYVEMNKMNNSPLADPGEKTCTGLESAANRSRLQVEMYTYTFAVPAVYAPVEAATRMSPFHPPAANADANTIAKFIQTSIDTLLAMLTTGSLLEGTSSYNCLHHLWGQCYLWMDVMHLPYMTRRSATTTVLESGLNVMTWYMRVMQAVEIRQRRAEEAQRLAAEQQRRAAEQQERTAARLRQRRRDEEQAGRIVARQIHASDEVRHRLRPVGAYRAMLRSVVSSLRAARRARRRALRHIDGEMRQWSERHRRAQDAGDDDAMGEADHELESLERHRQVVTQQDRMRH